MSDFQIYTISFQINFQNIQSWLKKQQMMISKIKYTLNHDQQEIFILYPEVTQQIPSTEDKLLWFNLPFELEDNSTRPTLVQFLVSNKSNYEHQFQIKFEITYKNQAISQSVNALLYYDNQIIPNMSILLDCGDSQISVILNTISSFDISQYTLYHGFVNNIGSERFEICFQDQGYEYILYKSPKASKNRKSDRFQFRYLNLSNRPIYVKNRSQNGNESRNLNVDTTIDEYISRSLSLDNDHQNPDICPLIKMSPLSIKNAVNLGKININFNAFAFGKESDLGLLPAYMKIAHKFFRKIGFHQEKPTAIFENQTSFTNVLGNTLQSSLRNAFEIRRRKRLISSFPSNLQDQNNYHTLFVYDSTSFDLNKSLEQNIINKLNCFISTPNSTSIKKDSPDIYSVSGKEMIDSRVNKGIYKLDYQLTEIKEENEIVELYSGLPIIIVTLFHDLNTNELENNEHFKLWNGICHRYHFIKLICVNQTKSDSYSQLRYVSELKVIHDLILKWLSQIPFSYKVQYHLNPMNCMIHDGEFSYNQYIHQRLLELLTFDYEAWNQYGENQSYAGYYYWPNTEQVLALLKCPLNNDILTPHLKGIKNEKIEKTRATIYAAALVFLYSSGDGNPAKFLYMMAIEWLKEQNRLENNQIYLKLMNNKFIKGIVEELRTMINHENAKLK